MNPFAALSFSKYKAINLSFSSSSNLQLRRNSTLRMHKYVFLCKQSTARVVIAQQAGFESQTTSARVQKVQSYTMPVTYERVSDV